MKWVENKIRIPLNGLVPTRLWSMTNVHGKKIAENPGVSGLTPYVYFLWMFRMSHLQKIARFTNVQLSFQGQNMKNGSELFKFLGTILLMSRFQFGSRRDLRTTESKRKYFPVPNFGNMIPFSRFDTLLGTIRFSDGGTPEIEGHAKRWRLVDDFIQAINAHREMFFGPSELIRVDEIMSR